MKFYLEMFEMWDGKGAGSSSRKAIKKEIKICVFTINQYSYIPVAGGARAGKSSLLFLIEFFSLFLCRDDIYENYRYRDRM